MRRRDFIKAVVGSATTWPFAARAQQPERMRRIGVLMNIAESDPQSAPRISALVRGLEELGWSLGKNVQIDYRWGAGDLDLYRKYAPELVALAPDVILAVGGTGQTSCKGRPVQFRSYLWKPSIRSTAA
jgi:putative ABC transport system substrate-binding protein